MLTTTYLISKDFIHKKRILCPEEILIQFMFYSFEHLQCIFFPYCLALALNKFQRCFPSKTSKLRFSFSASKAYHVTAVQNGVRIQVDYCR